MIQAKVIKFDVNKWEVAADNDVDFRFALVCRGDGSESDFFGLYGGAFPAAGVPAEEIGAHVHITKGGSVGIWSSLNQTTTIVGDKQIKIGTWTQTFSIDDQLQFRGPFVIGAEQVIGLRAVMLQIIALSETHPELGIDRQPFDAALERSAELTYLE